MKLSNSVYKTFIVFAFIAIFAVSGCTSSDNGGGEPASDCDYYCLQEGYGQATDSSCVSFTSCDDPNNPVSADMCEGLELCCCKS